MEKNNIILYCVVIFCMLLFVFIISAVYNKDRLSVNDKVNKLAIEQDCNYLAFVENERLDTQRDCFVDVFYNRGKELNRSGMMCYFDESGNFLLRCKW